MTKLTIGTTVQFEQAYFEKNEARKYFGLDNKSQSYFQKLIVEFKDSKFNGDKPKGYLAPTYGVVLLHIQSFTDFMEWRHDDKFKRKKVS